MTTGGGPHDLRTQPVPVRRLGAADTHLQGLAFSCGQHDRHGTRAHRGSRGKLHGCHSLRGTLAIYSAARERYDDAVLRTGLPTGTPQEALDTACTIHLAGLG